MLSSMLTWEAALDLGSSICSCSLQSLYYTVEKPIENENTYNNASYKPRLGKDQSLGCNLVYVFFWDTNYVSVHLDKLSFHLTMSCYLLTISVYDHVAQFFFFLFNLISIMMDCEQLFSFSLIFNL